MAEATVEAFWTRFVTRAGEYPGAVTHARSTDLPELFLQLTTRGSVSAVHAPGLCVGAVGDWLGWSLERHQVMRRLADANANPVLASMVPFGDSPDGFEVALDLRGRNPRVVWLDPGRYEDGPDAVVAVVAESVEAFVASLAQHDARGAGGKLPAQ